MSTIALRTWSQVNTDARFLLNDMGGIVFTDAVLVTPDALAYSWMESAFENIGFPVTDKIVQNLTYAANALTISVGDADIYEPTHVYQRMTSSDQWMEITQNRVIPPQPPVVSGYISIWAWNPITRLIDVISAIQNLQIAVQYQIMHPYTVPTDTVGIDDVYWCGCHKVAEFAASVTGRDSLKLQNAAWYNERFQIASNRRVRLQQRISRTPRRYGRGR